MELPFSRRYRPGYPVGCLYLDLHSGLAGSFLCTAGKHFDQPLFPGSDRSLAVYLCLFHDDCQVPDHERHGYRDQAWCAADGTDPASKSFQSPKRIPGGFPANPGLTQDGVYTGRHAGDEHLLDDQQYFLVNLRYGKFEHPARTPGSLSFCAVDHHAILLFPGHAQDQRPGFQKPHVDWTGGIYRQRADPDCQPGKGLPAFIDQHADRGGQLCYRQHPFR